MTNGHLQTIYAALTASYYKSKVSYERVILTAEDGGKISVDWEGSEPQSPMKRPILLILHGLTGGSHESYVQDLILALKPHGFQCVVFNFRGCSGSEIVTPQLYSASYTQDLDLVVNHVKRKVGQNSMLLGAGYSLGANILLKFAGQSSENCPFDGLLSIANPFDLTATNAELHRGFWKRTIYSARLASNLIRVLKRWAFTTYISLKM
jgi:predicted alpha/beta-fold hydrolase